MPELSIADKGKEAAGKRAAELIVDGMLVGLGSGTTAAFFIEALGRRCREEGLRIGAVATSAKTAQLAEKAGIPLLNIDHLTRIDIDVDGADEIDPQKQMIKGGGGALTREKIIAAMANEMVVVVDENKCVPELGKFPLPVEILPFGHEATLEKIREKGLRAELRKTAKKTLYVTDNGNYIAELHLNPPLLNPAELNRDLHLIPGVVETGLFVDMAGRVIIGHADGRTTVLN